MRVSSIGIVTLSCGAIIATGWQLGAQKAVTTSPDAQSNATMPASSVPQTTAAPNSAGTSAPPSNSGSKTAVSTPSAPKNAQHPDGTYTGSVVSTRYGTVQVAAVYTGGKITDIQALKLTDRGAESVQISAQASPILRSEVLSAQSAQVQSVSGATYTSQGYLTSLQAAIDKYNAA